MALNWNQIQARKSARASVLAGNPIDSSTPTQTTDLGGGSRLEPTAAESIPEWRIEGVSPVEVGVISGNAPPPPEKPPLWPSKPRPSTFAVEYENLDSALDADLISEYSLEETKPGVWTQVLGEPEPL